MMALRRQHLDVAALTLVTVMVVIWLTHLPLPKQQVGFACDLQTCRKIAVPPDNVGAPFTESAVDLTGDGNPEVVRLEGHEIRVLQNGTDIWRSNPTWQVVDLALGDPNDDGRYEILAALWKPNDTGENVSHPYIIAHRGGAMKLIWGGSAVTRPIYELELTDIDGDHVQELVVLEAVPHSKSPTEPLRTLSIWDWHGWGFNLRWRSEEDRYRNLGVVVQGSRNIIVMTVE